MVSDVSLHPYSVASQDDMVWVTRTVGEDLRNGMWKKCFDKRVDSNSNSNFHIKCNMRGPSVTIVKLKSNGRDAL